MSVDWHPEKFNKRKHDRTVEQLQKAAFLVERNAKILCPVDTGRLRASITTQVDDKIPRALIGTNVHYGIYVELGTYKMSAQPYLVPALVMNRNAIARLFGAI